MPGDLVRVRHGPQRPAAPPDVLEAVGDGHKGRQILQDGVSVSVWSDTGRSAVLHNI